MNEAEEKYPKRTKEKLWECSDGEIFQAPYFVEALEHEICLLTPNYGKTVYERSRRS